MLPCANSRLTICEKSSILLKTINPLSPARARYKNSAWGVFRPEPLKRLVTDGRVKNRGI
jgi:hypothetical protein